jgi:hemin uptake protein HemP
MNHITRIPRGAPLRRIMREAAMSTDKNSLPAEAVTIPMPAMSSASEAICGDEQKRIWKSDDLLGTETEALIVHRGQTYRLRCTKQGKLILYK